MNQETYMLGLAYVRMQHYDKIVAMYEQAHKELARGRKHLALFWMLEIQFERFHHRIFETV